MFEVIGIIVTLIFGLFVLVSGIAMMVLNNAFGDDKPTKCLGFWTSVVGAAISVGVLSVLQVSVK